MAECGTVIRMAMLCETRRMLFRTLTTSGRVAVDLTLMFGWLWSLTLILLCKGDYLKPRCWLGRG